jgi:hypothetical protein
MAVYAASEGASAKLPRLKLCLTLPLHLVHRPCSAEYDTLLTKVIEWNMTVNF